MGKMERISELLQRRIWLGLLLAVAVGIAVGLPLGWLTVDWRPGPDDVAAIADSFSVNNNLPLAQRRLQGLSKADLERILTNLIRESNSKNLTPAVDRLNQLAQAMGVTIGPATTMTPGPTPATARSPTATPPSVPALVGTLVPLGLILLVVALIATAALVFFLWVLLGLRTPRTARRATSRTATSPTAARATAPAVVTTVPGGLGRFVASYALGDDNYDTAFSLETARQDFLGECGLGISETVGEGKPDRVTAFDLWLFDKADVRTVTQIVMSEYAFNDPGLRAKLAQKGDAVLAEKGKTMTLETQSLRIDAQIVELVYAMNPSFPSNSHFQKLTIEIVPTLKEATAP